MQLYFDYGATTPCRAEAIAAMVAAYEQQWGNPSSIHEWGQRAAIALEQARLQVAGLIHAQADEIIFTSGGTEADNLALLGICQRYRQPQHLIISAVEHSAVAQPAAALEAQGWQVTRLAVNHWGQVEPAQLRQALQPNTVLVSIIYGQSEVGTLQPIAELAAICQEAGVLFHTDAVQVAGRVPLDVQRLGVDLLSLSSHKIYGPQGAGALYVRSGVPLEPLLRGGGQELGLRAGTQAVPTLVGFGVAAEWVATELATEPMRLAQLRDRLWQQLQDHPQVERTGHPWQRLPHHLSLIVRDRHGQPLNGKTFVRQLNLAGIGISAGSACQSGQTQPSPTLLAMGYDPETAKAGIRITLGRETTAADVDWLAMVLRQYLAEAIAPPLAVSLS
ncbi:MULTISPECIES: cysteine desulfurase family protein [unclassified Thermosynechococcus]|uniref:cysteine desulfurase family protein n=1 Tax=unclassified Thermosynechococcus TaxID=2622553 RepID=UPI002673DA73|nr:MULTISPECIES: cysteine desulfurase family protein [unclassified Thermosynechococcus]WKT83943.1 cysteine desulfurase family protein [Thermosynechococcus sp. HY596]WNC63076.1 cysteine desulfurase family protein [Thermosynechococcus sp. HY591]WNC65635.1 cysteine desulfurase family protein [Thermosynechococcus sp. HY593]